MFLYLLGRNFKKLEKSNVISAGKDDTIKSNFCVYFTFKTFLTLVNNLYSSAPMHFADFTGERL